MNRESVEKMKFYEVKEENQWNVNIAADLMSIREGIMEIGEFQK